MKKAPIKELCPFDNFCFERSTKTSEAGETMHWQHYRAGWIDSFENTTKLLNVLKLGDVVVRWLEAEYDAEKQK